MNHYYKTAIYTVCDLLKAASTTKDKDAMEYLYNRDENGIIMATSLIKFLAQKGFDECGKTDK